MTIALFSDSYLPTKSGIVTVVIQLREQLIKLGHKVLLVTVETTDEYKTDDPLIYRVHSKPLGLGTDQFISLPFLPPILKFIKDDPQILTFFIIRYPGVKSKAVVSVHIN